MLAALAPASKNSIFFLDRLGDVSGPALIAAAVHLQGVTSSRVKA